MTLVLLSRGTSAATAAGAIRRSNNNAGVVGFVSTAVQHSSIARQKLAERGCHSAVRTFSSSSSTSPFLLSQQQQQQQQQRHETTSSYGSRLFFSSASSANGNPSDSSSYDNDPAASESTIRNDKTKNKTVTKFSKELHTAPLSTIFASSADEYSLPLSTTTHSQDNNNNNINNNNEDMIINLRKGQRIVSFGDVHGDITALTNFLNVAQIMDDASTPTNPIWSGKDTICVQCGDILDRGDDELQCLQLLSSLSRQAVECGGKFIFLLGNHEALNSVGLFQYANPGGNDQFDSFIGMTLDHKLGTDRWRLQFANNQPSRWASMEPGGLLSRQTLANMKVAIVVGRTCFVHAGLTAQHLREYGGIGGMNKAARDWFLQAHHGDNNNFGIYQTIDEIIESAQRRATAASESMPDCLGGGIGSASPVWMRDYSQPNDKEPKNPRAQFMIDEALQELGHDVQRMVMGHTPQFKINAALKGKAWRIDVGASRGVMGGSPEVLEIIHRGGDNDDDLIHILTMSGERIKSVDRHVMEQLI